MIEDSTQHKSSWISVNDRVPTNILTVLVKCKELLRPTIAYYSPLYDKWRFTEYDYQLLSDKYTVEAWMPLPSIED